MLDNIKKRIAEQTADVVTRANAKDDDTALVAEYAHMFQELSDLSIDGDGSSRSIELLLDDDGKLEPDPIDDIELEEIGYPGLYYFTAGKYNDYGTPWKKVGDHYFSTK